jgi:L-lactate utilization protein LutC
LEDAKNLVTELVPKGAEVMTMTSVTLAESGIEKMINETGDYDAVKTKLYALDRSTQAKEMATIGAVHDYTISSAHALTQNGQLIIASATGSQLPAITYTSSNVILVISSKKIVKDLDEGFERLENYVLPLESERARKAYGVEGSVIAKALIYSKEVIPNRTTVIIVDEVAGY